MRRGMLSLGALLVALTLFAGLGSGAAAAGPKKLVEGTVYDTSCGAACSPCPPPCGGPISAPQTRGDVICARTRQRQIACPLTSSAKGTAAPDFCIQGEPCGVDYPIYSGEGAVVNIRKRGSSTVLATLPVVEGHFNVRLAPGEYVMHPYLPEPQCWSGPPSSVAVEAKMKSPVTATVTVGNSCVPRTDAAR